MIETVVLDYALEEPAHGQTRTSNELRKRGSFVSPSGVRSIWLRHDLACFKNRLKALSDKVAAEGLILTESQVAAMERKKDDDEACGEIETAHPGYFGSQDTYYVGTFKGIGRVYQQTFVDTYSKVAQSHMRSCIRLKNRLQQQIFSMIECCHSTRNTSFPCCVF